jgi:hypothetical protein
MLVIGLAAIVVILVLEIDGAPSWLHWITWIGGGLFAAGIANLANAIRSRNVPKAGKP